ncbi:MAG: DUF4412 domain-containing protein [Gemmatimonadaceae bacterium]
MSMPSRPRRIIRRSIWPVALVALPLALFATPALETGFTYDFRVSSTSTQGDQTKELSVMAGRGRVAGDKARIDLSEAKNGGPMFTGKGGYVMVKDGGSTMYMVDPGEKHYYSFNLEQMFAGLGSTLRMMGGMVKMTMTDVKIDVQDLGAGERIQGYSTRHVRQTQSHTISVSVLGRKSTTASVDTTEMWIAPDLEHVGNPFLRMGSAAAGMDFGNPDFRKQSLAAQAKIPAGLPLRSVSRNHSTDDKGKTSVIVSTMEVTNFQKGDIPASTFAIPGDYEEVPMPFAELAAMGDSVDAARARDGAANGAAADKAGSEKTGDELKDAVKEAGKEGVKEEAKKKLRGLFRKP